MKVIEPSVIHHIQNGVLEGKDIESYTKRYHEVNYLYEKQREDDHSDTLHFKSSMQSLRHGRICMETNFSA